MATIQIQKYTATVNGDTGASASTLVLRDAFGGITAATVTATAVDTTTYTGTVVTKSASFTAATDATDYLCDATSANITVTLPLASASPGVEYHFVKKDSSGHTVTLTGALGVSTLSTQYQGCRLFCDGSNWYGV